MTKLKIFDNMNILICEYTKIAKVKMRVIIIGGGACGASCATRLRRLDENCEITILERTNEVSIANCGLPYYCSKVINDREKILQNLFLKWKLFTIDISISADILLHYAGE